MWFGGKARVHLVGKIIDWQNRFSAGARTHGTPGTPQHLLAIPTYFLYFRGFLYGIPAERVRGDAGERHENPLRGGMVFPPAGVLP